VAVEEGVAILRTEAGYVRFVLEELNATIREVRGEQVVLKTELGYVRADLEVLLSLAQDVEDFITGLSEASAEVCGFEVRFLATSALSDASSLGGYTVEVGISSPSSEKGLLMGPLSPVPKMASTRASADPASALDQARASSSGVGASYRLTVVRISLSMAQLALASPVLMFLPRPSRMTDTLAPLEAMCLAAAMPSPPLFPVPATTTTLRPSRPPNSLETSSATALPAFSMRREGGRPRKEQFSSRMRISLEEMVFNPITPWPWPGTYLSVAHPLRREGDL